MARTSIYADLLRIIAVTDVQDYGEGGAASCPHCGAQGRYIEWKAKQGRRY